ncbi:AB hydrolase superfamily protein B1A11.02 [Fonsecaea pedrosoi]|nr:AB hydrolase superfamily protein B1A11.02 [Fonsecaea pedrosoi]
MPYDTKEEILALGVIDPELKALLEANPPPPMTFTTMQALREDVKTRTLQAIDALGRPPPSVKQSDISYRTADGTELRARLYQPTSPSDDGSPLIVMFHGGGFCLGIPEAEEKACREFVQAFNAVCVSPAYRLAPEFPFPQGPKDAWDALKWAAESASSWGADPAKGFIVGGSSAGGNLACVVTHLARDEGLSPPLTGHYLCIAGLVPPSRMPDKYKKWAYSYEQNKSDPINGQAVIDIFNAAYKPDLDDGIYNGPLIHPKGHAGLPPAFLQVNGSDTLRDDSLIYERILREEHGIKTKLVVYPGLPHAHWAFFPSLKASAQFWADQLEGMGWLLGKTPAPAKI